MRTLARHHLIEYELCDAKLINSPRFAAKAIRELCRQVRLNPVSEVKHEFSPHGLTVLVILAESHVALSTWPEHRYAALNLLHCGTVKNMRKAVAAFGKSMRASKFRHRSLVCATTNR